MHMHKLIKHDIFQKGSWIEHSKKRFKVHTQMIIYLRVVLFEFVVLHLIPLSTDHLRSQGSVRTLQFILFLYIQQIHKISFKASLVSGGEEYPCRFSSLHQLSIHSNN